MFLEEIRDGKVKLNKALSQLYENGPKVKPFPCAVFASSFREIALRIVPPWVSPSSESVLEASRQVFAWLHFLSSESAGSSGEVNEVLVHKVELRTIEGSRNGADQLGRFDHDIRTEIRISDLIVDGLSSADPSCKQVLVSKERLDDVKPETLAAAFWGSYQSPYNFYFGFPPNGQRFHKHARLDLLHPQDFDNLLQTTNEVDAFKMIGPLQLGACTSSTLPIITLDSEGWVSKYDQQDAECSQREFYTENIFRKEVLAGSDPGQHLLQKLSPLTEKRKKEGNWELDSWDEASKAIDVRTLEEAIVICVDRSGSMGTAMDKEWNVGQSGGTTGSDLNRLSEVKEIFKNLVTRISAYRLPTQHGLVTFFNHESVQVNQELTPVLYDFQDRLNDVSYGGGTSIYDALMKAKAMLATFAVAHPGAKRRIILLTDGCDNASNCTPERACKELCNNDIVLDAIVIGTDKTWNLFKIAKHTGGYAFNPTSRDLLF
ncbi:hypothetical protein MMC30_009432 [Trapelia coarctata]|nr:hypothetical protein [Trapelia coarctata]